jgi:hypothetical protein
MASPIFDASLAVEFHAAAWARQSDAAEALSSKEIVQAMKEVTTADRRGRTSLCRFDW